MKKRWKVLLSSATEHDRLVSELYFDDIFVLLVSNENDAFEVELSKLPALAPIPYSEFVIALKACMDRLDAAISPT